MGLPNFLAKTQYQTPTNGDDGPVQYGLKTDQHFFALLQSNARLGSAFNQFMTGYAKARPRWTDFYPVKQRLGVVGKSEVLLVDVGGGLGHETMGLSNAYPGLSGKLIVQDTPSVIQEAQSSKKLPSNIEAVAHDFFTPQLEAYSGARAYFMRLNLHDWPDNKSTIILGHLHDAMKKGHSKILINEAVLLDTGAPWQQTSLDWTMMGMLVSRERTESQWRELLAGCGLKVAGIWSEGSESVIEAVLAEERFDLCWFCSVSEPMVLPSFHPSTHFLFQHLHRYLRTDVGIPSLSFDTGFVLRSIMQSRLLAFGMLIALHNGTVGRNVVLPDRTKAFNVTTPIPLEFTRNSSVGHEMNAMLHHSLVS